MSKELQRHEGVYTKTSGTCGALAEVNIASVAKEHATRWPSRYLVCARSKMGLLQEWCIPIFGWLHNS